MGQFRTERDSALAMCVSRLVFWAGGGSRGPAANCAMAPADTTAAAAAAGASTAERSGPALSAAAAHSAVVFPPTTEQSCAVTAADCAEADFLPASPAPVDAPTKTSAPNPGSYTPDEDDGIMAFVYGWYVAL